MKVSSSKYFASNISREIFYARKRIEHVVFVGRFRSRGFGGNDKNLKTRFKIEHFGLKAVRKQVQFILVFFFFYRSEFMRRTFAAGLSAYRFDDTRRGRDFLRNHSNASRGAFRLRFYRPNDFLVRFSGRLRARAVHRYYRLRQHA